MRRSGFSEANLPKKLLGVSQLPKLLELRVRLAGFEHRLFAKFPETYPFFLVEATGGRGGEREAKIEIGESKMEATKKPT